MLDGKMTEAEPREIRATRPAIRIVSIGTAVSPPTLKTIIASADGKQVGLSLTIDASVKPGPRIVRVKTPNSESSWKSDAAVFTVAP